MVTLSAWRAKDILDFVVADPNSGCWLWEGALSRKGYGTVAGDGENKPIGAHRASYAKYVGKIPDGMWVLHKCDMPSCVRPDHLFIGTPRDNVLDMHRKGRGPKLGAQGRKSRKLTLEQILEIRSTTLPLQRLAKKFGVSWTCIKQVKDRKVFKYIGESA